MKIVIFGAGAIGGLLGAHLAGNNDVTLVCRKEFAAAVNRDGLRVTGLSDIRVRPKAVTSARGLEPPDMLFITVKAYDTRAAAAEVRHIAGAGTMIVSLQNGLGNLEAIAEALPHAKVVAGVTSHGALVTEPGVIEHTGRSYTVVGGPGAEPVAKVLSEAGIETSVSGDIKADIWYKALVNSAINPIATLMRSPNRVLVEDARLRELAGRVVSEGSAVARAGGIGIDEAAAFDRAMRVAADTAGNRNSMLLDAERGRRTEIMQMNGAISAYGREAGIPTPANDLLTTLINALPRA